MNNVDLIWGLHAISFGGASMISMDKIERRLPAEKKSPAQIFPMGIFFPIQQ